MEWWSGAIIRRGGSVFLLMRGHRVCEEFDKEGGVRKDEGVVREEVHKIC